MFLRCEDGRASGGTGQAICIAQEVGVPVFNAYGCETKINEFVTLVANYVESLKN